jgi:hypothetical protein
VGDETLRAADAVCFPASRISPGELTCEEQAIENAWTAQHQAEVSLTIFAASLANIRMFCFGLEKSWCEISLCATLSGKLHLGGGVTPEGDALTSMLTGRF